MKQMVFVVFYNTGEYESQSQFIEKIFSSRQAAMNYCEERNNLFKEKGIHFDNCTASYEERQAFAKELGYYHIDYTGAEFTFGGPYEVDS